MAAPSASQAGADTTMQRVAAVMEENERLHKFVRTLQQSAVKEEVRVGL